MPRPAPPSPLWWLRSGIPGNVIVTNGLFPGGKGHRGYCVLSASVSSTLWAIGNGGVQDTGLAFLLTCLSSREGSTVFQIA